MKLTIRFFENECYEIFEDNYLLDCFVISRNKISKGLIEKIQDESRGNCFVYFLIDSFEGKKGKRKFYIGETKQLYNRLNSHKSCRKWWDKAILFTGNSKAVDSNVVEGLEKMLIDKYELDEFYDLDNSEGSNANIKDSYEVKLEYILMILDYLNYGLNEDKNQLTDVPEKEITDGYKLSDYIDKQTKQLNSNIESDQKKLYKSYSINGNGLYALWPKENGTKFEAEIYSNVDSLKEFKAVYDITSRSRGKRQCALKITKKEDADLLVTIIKKILGNENAVFSSKKSNFSFTMLNIKKGEILHFIDNESIICEVFDDHTVIYKGEKYSLSKLAKLLSNAKNNVSGSLFFTYNGTRLDILREKLGK